MHPGLRSAAPPLRRQPPASTRSVSSMPAQPLRPRASSSACTTRSGLRQRGKACLRPAARASPSRQDRTWGTTEGWRQGRRCYRLGGPLRMTLAALLMVRAARLIACAVSLSPMSHPRPLKLFAIVHLLARPQLLELNAMIAKIRLQVQVVAVGNLVGDAPRERLSHQVIVALYADPMSALALAAVRFDQAGHSVLARMIPPWHFGDVVQARARSAIRRARCAIRSPRR